MNILKLGVEVKEINMERWLNKIHCGDVLSLTKDIPDKSVDCIITSPPYWQLRDYGYPDQWGLEPTYQEYLEHLWRFVDECKRVLKKEGTAWINLGDTYGTGAGGNNMKNHKVQKMAGCKNLPGEYNRKDNVSRKRKPIKGFKKCLLLIPHRFAIGCIDRGWILRNDIVWAKRNNMPESITDRFSKKHEYFFFMTKNEKYYFDLDGIRDIHKDESIKRAARAQSSNDQYSNRQESKHLGYNDLYDRLENGELNKVNANGKNPGSISDFWDITTKGSSEKHYASFNFKLIEKPIIAGCPEFVCKKCGKPRENIIKIKSNPSKREDYGEQPSGIGQQSSSDWKPPKINIVGLTDCGCNAGFDSGIILDPFCGTGTTLVRALQLNRKIIGIDGSKEYCKIAEKNINTELSQIKMF